MTDEAGVRHMVAFEIGLVCCFRSKWYERISRERSHRAAVHRLNSLPLAKLP